MNSSVEKKIGVILQYSQMILGILISFIYTPIMLNILGQAQYGIYNLANSIISYLSLLSLGFGASYIRFYSRYNKDEDIQSIRKLNGLYLIVFLIMGTIAFISGLSLSSNVSLFFNETYTDEELKIAGVLMKFMSFNLALSFPNSVFTAYVTSKEKFVFQKLINIAKTVISPFVTLPVLLMGYGSIGMIGVTTAITLLADISNIMFCVCKLKMGFNFRKLDLRLLREIAVFSMFIAINQIVDQINWATDKIILGKVCTSAAVAIYAVGSQINTYYLQFSSSISSVFVPQIHKIVASDEDELKINNKLTKIFVKVGRVQFMILMLILTGFIFFGKFFVIKWAGENYKNAYYVTLTLMAPTTVPLVQNIGLEIQKAKNMHQFRSYLYLAMAILNVLISIFFAKLWGEIGAAMGTAISIILVNGVIMNVYYHKKIGIDIIYFWKEIAKFLPAFFGPFIAGIIINIREFENFIEFVVGIFFYCIIYTISFYFAGMNQYEKEMVRAVLHKILKINSH